ncbi:MAG TPA: delta-60 repeat domain-containing protein, partial [Flavobacteriales bacterium]|nr:delta-60 repeat domain-containing protein [Flavobacteriales bacterium]
GSLDTGFNPGTGANFLVTSVAIQADGKILIGGFFNDYNGTTVVALARLNSNGSLDTGYNSGGAGPNNSVAAISLQPDGKALVGGSFTTYNGTGRNRIMRVNTNGSLDTGFTPGSGANNAVLAFAIQSNGAIILGGDFTTFNGNTHNRHCRVSSAGVEDVTWTTGAGNTVNTLCWTPEGKVLVGGLFTAIAAHASIRLARLNALCTDNVSVTVTTDGNAAQNQWELIPSGYSYAAYSGTGFPNNAIFSSSACLADGCYELRFTDSGGDGITGGGYILKSQSGDRIIDDEANFSTGSTSQISGGQGGPVSFCIPIGTHKPIYVSRDKLDWVDGEYIVASESNAVTAVWTGFGSGSPERASTGYDFWFFDPNGGYSFVRQRRHSSSDGFGPANATRACHMKINNWALANHIPAST